MRRMLTIGKHLYKSFPKKAITIVKNPLNSFVFRSMLLSNFGEGKYFQFLFMILINKKNLGVFFKEKIEVFNTFKKFKAYVEEESDYDIQVMRLDRVGEFTLR